MAKKMKVNDISNLYSQEFPCKKVLIQTNKGQEFEVLVQEKLNETSIMELILEVANRSNYCAKNNITFNEMYNIYYLLIKYFTDIQFTVY
jgi:hypothetical protein